MVLVCMHVYACIPAIGRRELIVGELVLVTQSLVARLGAGRYAARLRQLGGRRCVRLSVVLIVLGRRIIDLRHAVGLPEHGEEEVEHIESAEGDERDEVERREGPLDKHRRIHDIDPSLERDALEDGHPRRKDRVEGLRVLCRIDTVQGAPLAGPTRAATVRVTAVVADSGVGLERLRRTRLIAAVQKGATREVRSQKPEVRRQTAAVRSQKAAVSCQKPAARRQKAEGRRQKAAARSQKPEARSQKPEASSQKPAVSSQKPEARSQKPEA